MGAGEGSGALSRSLRGAKRRSNPAFFLGAKQAGALRSQSRLRRRSRVLTPVLFFLLRAGPADFLDRERRAATFFGDLAVLFHDESARRLVAVEPAEQLRPHAPGGTLRAVFINDVEEGKFAFGIGPWFFGHAGFWSIRAPLSIARRLQLLCEIAVGREQARGHAGGAVNVPAHSLCRLAIAGLGDR